MRRHRLGVLQGAPIGQISRDARCAERVAANGSCDPGGGGPCAERSSSTLFWQLQRESGCHFRQWWLGSKRPASAAPTRLDGQRRPLRDLSWQLKAHLPVEDLAGCTVAIDVLATRRRFGKDTRYRLTEAGPGGTGSLHYETSLTRRRWKQRGRGKCSSAAPISETEYPPA
jgi:hypothetical protein